MTGAIQASLRRSRERRRFHRSSSLPSSQITTSADSFENTGSFTAAFNIGTPTSITWSVESITGGTAMIVSGQGTANANVKATANDDGVGTVLCTVRCTAIIGGNSYSATATKRHHFRYGGGGGTF
jgi:hypothetical protein